MSRTRLSENPHAVRRTVLTSLSLLVSTNCAWANAAGSFVSPTPSSPTSWHPIGGHLFHENSLNILPHQAFAVGNQRHGSTSGLPHTNSTFLQSSGVPAGSLLPLTSGGLALPNSGYQLDLSSSTANIALGTKLFNWAESVTINAGGQSLTFRPGSQVTAGEFVAIKEVLAGGSQSIELSSTGTAVGGTFSLNQIDSPKLSLLVIPQSVTGIDYLSSAAPISIHGDLVNYGSIYDVSTKAGITSGSIFAQDITNESGGLISTQLPGSLATSITNAVSSTSLILGAINNLTNAGTITSGGNLTLATNSGAVTNNGGATLSAGGNVNLLPGNGNLVNAGLIASSAGNINIASTTLSNNINVNGANGTFQAMAGAINVRDASYTGAGNINISGGNYQSQSLNLYSGTGAITGSVGQVTGTLNTSGDAAHFTADTANLVLGNNCLKGDPTFANTGDITISGAIIATEDLTIVAGGNINADAASSLSTANSVSFTSVVNPTTDITLIAGATVATGSSISPVTPTSVSTGSATVDFSSGNGGSINLAGVSIDTSSNLQPTTSNQVNQPNGGNVLLVAKASADGLTGGTVTTGTISTSSTYGSGGSVTIIAGANPTGSIATTVNVGDITTGGNGSGQLLGAGGKVSIYTQQPGAATGSTISFNADGSVASGKVVPAGAVSPLAQVQLTNVVTGGDSVANAGFSLVGGDIKIVAGNVVVASGGTLNTQATFGGNINIQAPGAVTTTGAIITTASTSTNQPGNSGDISINAASLTAGTITTSGGLPFEGVFTGFANGGNVYINTTGATSIGLIDASGNGGDNIPGDIIVNAGGALTFTGGTTSIDLKPVNGAIFGGNVLLGSLGNMSISAPGGATTTDISAIGSIMAVAGAVGSPATITIAGAISNENTRPGVIELINNSSTVGTVNLTVGGTINADTTAGGGQAGSIAIVSSGAIKTGNISATSSSNFGSGATGGGVFISSGGSGTNAITVGTITTGAASQLGGAAGGDVILISSGTKTAVNPANIKHGTISQLGDTKGVSLIASLSTVTAPTTIPAQINISETITGANAINIRPGGYQGAQSSANLIINNPSATMVAPINVAATGNALSVGTIKQSNGVDNLNIVTSGAVTFTQPIQTTANTGSIVIASLGGIQSSGSPILNLATTGAVLLFSPTAGINLGATSITATNSIVVGGALNTSSMAGNGQSVSFNTSFGSITTSDINTSSSGVGTNAGNISLTGPGGISTGNIDASSHDGSGGFNGPGGGSVVMQSNASIKIGDITNSGNALVQLNNISNTGANFGILRTGDIQSIYSAPGQVTNVVLNGGGLVQTGDITTSAASGNSGSVSINSGFYGALIGNIDTSSKGNTAGSVLITGDGANGPISIASINASTSGTTQTGGGGNVIVANNSGNFSWGVGGINTSATYTGAGNGNGGAVILSASDSIYGGSVNTSAVNKAGTGNGGAVFLNGSSIFMSTIDTSAFGANATSGTGGAVTLCGGNSGIITTAVITRGITQGGSLFETATSLGFIVNNIGIDTSSQGVGGSVTSISNGVFFTPSITTSATTIGSGSVTGGSVMIACLDSQIIVSGLIDTSASSQGGNAQAGSVGVADRYFNSPGVNLNGINASATTTGVTNSAIAGDIFVSSSQNITLGQLNTSTTGGAPGTNFGQIILGSAQGTVPLNITYTTTGTNTPVGYTFNNSNTISGPTATINVTSGASLNINPGGYNGIGTGAPTPAPVSLTLDFGGDSRLLVPIISTGGIFISGVTADNTTGGTFKNGYDVHLINSSGTNDFVISGDVTSKAFAGGTPGNIQFADLVGTISQTGGTIAGNSLILESFVGVGATLQNGTLTPSPINTTAAAITANAFSPGFNASVYITTAATTPVALVGINEAVGSSSVFSFTATDNAANVSVAANAIVLGATTSLLATGTGGTLNVAGLVLGNAAVANTTLQAANLTISSSGRVAATALVLESSLLTNNGSVSTSTGTLAIDNQNALSHNLTVVGTGSFTSPTAISLSALGNVDFGGLFQGGALNLLPGESLLIVAGGNITATGGSTNFSINTSSGVTTGGSVSMFAGSTYTLPAANGKFNDLEVDTTNLASTTGGSIILDGSNGGYVLTNINTTSTAGAAGNVLMVAQGPAAGTNVILLPSTGSVATGGLTQNGSVSLFALGPNSSGKAIVVGNINTGGPGFTSGTGEIDLETNTLVSGQSIVFHHGVPSIIPFTPAFGTGTGSVQSGLLQTNSGIILVIAAGDVNLGMDSTANANNIQITSQTGTLNLPLISSISAAVDPSGNGNGGTIILNAPTITWLGSTGTTPLVLNADAVNGSSGAGGDVEFITTNTAALTLGSSGANTISMSANGAPNGGAGGEVFLKTGGPVNFDPTFFQASVKGANGSGGFLHLEGSLIIGPSPLVLSANGVGNGNGGEVDIVQSDPTAVAANAFQLSATSGLLGGNGGFAQFSAGGDLAVNPTQIKVNPLGKTGAGGGIELDAGTNGPGNLAVSGPLIVNGKGTAAGGGVTLISNSSNAFMIGAKVSHTVPAPLNGIVGLPTATGKPTGGIDVENNGGDVTNVVALTAFSGITLKTDGAGNVVLGASLGNATADVALEAQGTGNVTTKSNAFVVSAGTLTVSTTTGNIQGVAPTNPLTVSALFMKANGNNVNISDKVAVNLNSSGATDSFTLIDTKNILSFSTTTAPTLNLTSSGFVAGDSKGLTSLAIDTSTLTVSGAGTFNLNNTGAAPITVNSQLVKSKVFTLNSNSDINVAGLIGSTTGNVTLMGNGSANVNTTGSGMISAKLLTVNAGGAVGSAAPLQANAVTTNAASATSIQIDENAATSTLGNLTTTNGSIDIKTAGLTAKVLQTLAIVGKAAGASITANSGHITIENDNVSKGSIVIGKGSHIITGGSGGDVTISMGIATKTPGTAPAGVNFTINLAPATPPFAAGPFYFGTAGITVAGTKAGAATIQMNSMGGGNVIFDTTTAKATAIKVNGNTTALPTVITADPPIPAGGQITALATTFTPAALSPTSNQAIGPIVSTSLVPLSVTSLTAPASVSGLQPAVSNPTNFAAGINAASVLTQTSSQTTRSATLNSLLQTSDTDWATDTELSTGEIPAVVYSDEDMGIHSDISTIVDIQPINKNAVTPCGVGSNSVTQSVSANGSLKPLEGGITKSVKAPSLESNGAPTAKAVLLKHGTVVFAPTVDTNIETPMGTVSVAAKSLVMVTVHRDSVAVYDLDDSHKNAVVVQSGGARLSLSPGKHILLTSNTNARFADVNPAQMIGYRNIREHQAQDGIKAFTSEFSLTQAVSVVQPLKRMVNSSNPHSRKVASHLLKTTSILMTIDPDRNGYQQMLRPRATAYAP